MHIICPHCTTSYAIDLATLGGAGRTVRCSRCKEVWLARPEDAIEAGAPVVAMAEAGEQASAQASAEQWNAHADGAPQTAGPDWPAVARDDLADAVAARPRRPSWFPRLLKPPAVLRASGRSFVSLPTACAAMGALVLALMIWRVEVVRLLPQTAPPYN